MAASCGAVNATLMKYLHLLLQMTNSTKEYLGAVNEITVNLGPEYMLKLWKRNWIPCTRRPNVVA